MNGTGIFIWGLLQEETTEGNMVKAILEEYEVDEETARNDTADFIKLLKENHIL